MNIHCRICTATCLLLLTVLLPVPVTPLTSRPSLYTDHPDTESVPFADFGFTGHPKCWANAFVMHYAICCRKAAVKCWSPRDLPRARNMCCDKNHPEYAGSDPTTGISKCFRHRETAIDCCTPASAWCFSGEYTYDKCCLGDHSSSSTPQDTVRRLPVNAYLYGGGVSKHTVMAQQNINKHVFTLFKYSLGLWDARLLMPHLQALLRRMHIVDRANRYVALDVGANVGRMTAQMIEHFTDFSCWRYAVKVAKQNPVVFDASTPYHPADLTPPAEPGQAAEDAQYYWWHAFEAYKRHSAEASGLDECEPPMPVISFEPVSETYDRLLEHGQAAGWDAVGWLPMETAITGPLLPYDDQVRLLSGAGKNMSAYVGQLVQSVSMWSRVGTSGDEIARATLTQEDGLAEAEAALKYQNGSSFWSSNAVMQKEVLGFPLDSLLHFEKGKETVNPAEYTGTGLEFVRAVSISRRLSERDIFLLKVDVEGWDAAVLLGAHRWLKEGRVKFFVFEYGRALNLPGGIGTGKPVKPEYVMEYLIDRLDKTYGYVCYVITKYMLVPISREYWNLEFFRIQKGVSEDAIHWANVFCGRESDPDLQLLVSMFNRDDRVWLAEH
eukprot:GDKI01049764.1.p1 GENE.GDKI01049764.1~~GDKI01049764.1.p1  ORF type:complete len:609 (-),score=139.73 GDKI01049764.1:48-1874(-)